jgi:hypothetical protein
MYYIQEMTKQPLQRKRKVEMVAYVLLALFVLIGPPAAFGFRSTSPTFHRSLSLEQHRLIDSRSASSLRQHRVSRRTSLHLLVEVRKEPITTTLEDFSDTAPVPTELSEAIRTFFFAQNYGPSLAAMALIGFSVARLGMNTLNPSDGLAFSGAIVFWLLQEHFLHQKLLHSSFDWIGKDIHEGHHRKPYYHVSLDPAGLMLGWLLTAHIVLRCLLPLPIAISATIGYASAGLFYEWAHYIVHTKVRMQSAFWKQVKNNHIRHHLLNDNYWFAFSLPLLDDLFQTNPPIHEVRKEMKNQR